MDWIHKRANQPQIDDMILTADGILFYGNKCSVMLIDKKMLSGVEEIYTHLSNARRQLGAKWWVLE
jgi:hypothetical protein